MYDCGLKINALRELKYYLKEEDNVNLIYLSHLCADHIRGIKNIKNAKDKKFKKWFKKTKFVLPYINDYDKFIPFFIMNNNLYTSDYAEIIVKDILWYSNEYDYNYNYYYYNFTNDDIQNAKINFRLEETEPPFINWSLIPYTYSDNHLRKEIIEFLQKDENINNEIEIFKYNNTINNAIRILDLWKEYINNNKDKWCKILNTENIKGDTSPSNLLSMTLYSGPIYRLNDTSNRVYEYWKNKFQGTILVEFLVYNPEKKYYKQLSQALFYTCHGWMHTGDANLLHNERYEKFKLYYRDIWQNIAIMSLPHHGSENNFNTNLSPDNCDTFVISPHFKVCKNTIITNIPKDKIVYCTLKQDFESTTIGNGIFISHYNVPELYNYNECPKYNN
jgi:hypothetical protein